MQLNHNLTWYGLQCYARMYKCYQKMSVTQFRNCAATAGWPPARFVVPLVVAAMSLRHWLELDRHTIFEVTEDTPAEKP